MRDMNIQRNVPLRNYSTMRLGGTATYLVDIHDRNELQEALAWAEQATLPVIMIGSGSNIIWKDEGYSGLILVNKILRFDELVEDEENYYVTVGAGEGWDSVVARTTAKGMTGIEALSLIPGTAGATPVQNVGAYGQEIADTLVSVEAYDTQTKQFTTIATSELGFGYRTSVLKTTARGRFFITAITLHLLHAQPQPPFYAAVQQYFEEHDIHAYTPQAIRSAVIAIRQSKLPDPAVVANTGSFFANPVIDMSQFVQLQSDYPVAPPHWQTTDGRIKLPAAWLVEQAGFKNSHDPKTGMATWPQQSLVLVNEHATSTAQLLAFRDEIIQKVQALFNITLEQEPELLP
jgi:UDP-N-acetylmuramate dehydrogenase